METRFNGVHNRETPLQIFEYFAEEIQSIIYDICNFWNS